MSAIVTPASVTVGWIGDSRAYWISPTPRRSACLTVDDSLAGRLAAGRPVPADLGVDPRSRALIRWLGADSDDAEPQVATLEPTGPGRLVLCSDGLSHYVAEPEAMAEAVAGMPATPVAVARGLTRMALDAGGHDNVAVTLLPFPPATGVDPAGGSVRGRRRHQHGHDGLPGPVDLVGPPEDPGVSHGHVLLVVQADGWAVVDLESANGTYVNDHSAEPIDPSTPVPVKDGDRIYLGAWTQSTVQAP